MGKSRDFVVSKISDGQITGYGLPEAWENAMEINPIEYAKTWMDERMSSGMTFTADAVFDGEIKKVISHIKYDPSAEFDYCTTKQIQHDGTLIFEVELLVELLNRVFQAQTYNKETAPEGFTLRRWEYETDYVIGDVVIHHEYGDQNVPDKPWIQSRTIAALPVSIKYTKIEV